MKTILYLITQSEMGGAQKYVFDLALGLKDEFNVCVGMGGGEEKGGEFAQKLKESNLEYYILKNLKREISPIKDFFTILEIIKLIKKLKPDVIHLNSSKISILGSIATKLCYVLRVPCYVIYTVHGWVFNEPLAKWKKLFYFFAEKLTAIFKDKIICISKLDYDIAKNRLKIKEKKLTLIYHGIKPINFLSQEEAREKLSQITNYKLQITNFAIGTIGNLYKTKGLEYLIEAINILKSQFPISLIIIGEGAERKNLEELIKKYGLEKNVFLAGSIKNAAEILPAIDIYVNSSVKEGFPYSILEAMSAGLPIVATKVGGIPEMITDGKNGLLVEPKNPKGLAEKIKTLIENKELRNTLSQQAQKNVKEKFGIGEMIEKTKEVYLR
jgi:glycosyltransferase involved in cell wall biosynthesis